MSMDSTCSERFLSALSDETECYLHPKRIKIESSQKCIGKEEQQKLGQSIHCVNRYQTSPHEPTYLPERQSSWALEKQSCDTERRTCTRECFHFQTCSSERLPCGVSENKLSTKKWNPENEDETTLEGDIALNVHRQPLKKEPLSVRSAGNTCENLQGLNPPQVQPSYNIEQNNKGNYNHELNQSSSVTPLNSDLFQMVFLSHKSISDKKWKQYQLLPIPFLCCTSSVFSHMEHEKNNFLKKGCSPEDKDCSSSDNESTAERDNKEKKPSSYIIPTLKPLKSIQPLEIPNFLLSSISNKINSKMPSTNSKETDWKNFKSQPSCMQSKQIHGVQKTSEMGKQTLQNAKSIIKASTVGSEFKENNYSSVSKQANSALAEGGKVSVTYFRHNSTEIECNKIFAENYFKDEMLENSDADDDQKSGIHSYVSARNIQNEKCVNCNDPLKRMVRKTRNKKMGTCHTQTSIPVITEPLEKKKIDILCGVHNSNSDISLYEAESKLSTKEILDFKRYLPKNITFESICPHNIVQIFSHLKGSCSIFRGNEMCKLKFSFQNMLFGCTGTWTESLYNKDMPMCQDDSVTHWFHFCKTLNERCHSRHLVKSNINRNCNSKIFIRLLAVISKHLKAEIQSRILPSFSNSTNTFLQTEGKPMQVEKHLLCVRKQDQLNLWQNTEFKKEKETYPGFVNLNYVESIGLELHNECQRSNFSASLGEEESTFLEKGTLFNNRKSGICKGRHVRKHHLLPRGSAWFTNCLRSVSCKNSKKKQTLVAKCLILLQGTFGCSSLDKMYFCIITKVQYLIGANLRFWSCFLAHSQLKFVKVNNKCTNQEISVTTAKQEKKKQSKMLKSSFHRGRFKAFPYVLCENKKDKTTEHRKCITSTNEVTNEVTYATKKYLGTSTYINGGRKECVKSKELQINAHNFLSKKSFSIIDTYEKIPLTSDSEDFDQIHIVNKDNCVRKKLFKENAVTSSKEFHNLPARSHDVLILTEQSKTTMEKCSSLLLQDSQTNQPEYLKKIGAYSPYLANKKIEDQNNYPSFENLFPSSSNVFQSVTLPLDSSSFVNTVACEDGHHRSSSSADKQKQSEKIRATVQYPSTGSPTMTDRYLQLQGKETSQFSLQGHTQMNKIVGLEPATLKQHLKYVEEQEEINDEQMHVTNESQCETLMNDLIMSYSEDESETFMAAEEELRMHLSIMNNGCLEDVKDKYLPLENKIAYEFELKRKFGLVLEELHMFHEISRGNESNLSSLETNSHNYCELNNSEGIDENVTSASQKKIGISSPICGSKGEQNITDVNESSLNEKISTENEDQEVSKEYSISRLSSEELLYSPVAEGYFDANYKKPYMWNPAFLSCTLRNEQNYNSQEEGGYILSRDVIRLQPLKTCKGPIRIGLSRKARPKQLHPYLK